MTGRSCSKTKHACIYVVSFDQYQSSFSVYLYFKKKNKLEFQGAMWIISILNSTVWKLQYENKRKEKLLYQESCNSLFVKKQNVSKIWTFIAK